MFPLYELYTFLLLKIMSNKERVMRGSAVYGCRNLTLFTTVFLNPPSKHIISINAKKKLLFAIYF